jgi:hypothetical protein
MKEQAMAKTQTHQPRQKMYRAIVYVRVDENEAGYAPVTLEEIKEFLNDALIVDVNTEDFDNPIGFMSAEVNLDSLEEIKVV